MKYMILGGGGVFGVHTALNLLEKNTTDKVVCVGRNRKRSEAFNLGLDEDKRYEYHQIHITFETEVLLELIDKIKPNYIVNFAALAYATSWHSAHRYYDTNIVALSKICEFLYNKDYLDRFLQVGSSEVYGSTKKPAKEDEVCNPTSPYSISKLCGDLHMLSLHNYNKFPASVIRPSNCYGPGQLLYRIIPKAALCFMNNNKFPLEGGGKAEKSFMHTKDLSEAISLILHKGQNGHIYNAGVNEPYTMKELIVKITKIMNIDFDKNVNIVPGRKFEDSKYWIDSSKINKELGWKAKMSIDDGLEDTINWVKKYFEELSKEDLNFVLKA